jgi:hypothetical protein
VKHYTENEETSYTKNEGFSRMTFFLPTLKEIFKPSQSKKIKIKDFFKFNDM